MGSWLPKPCFPLGYLIGIPLNLPFQLLFTPYLFCCYSLPLACSQKLVSSTFTCCFPPLISCFETFQTQGSDQQKGVSRSWSFELLCSDLLSLLHFQKSDPCRFGKADICHTADKLLYLLLWSWKPRNQICWRPTTTCPSTWQSQEGAANNAPIERWPNWTTTSRCALPRQCHKSSGNFSFFIYLY